jgi:uncharacterized repeat protein (TIGR02543 family)
LNVTAAEINAEANSTAMGIVIDGAIATITGFSYSTNATLKNLTVTATTRTGAEADGVMIANYKRNLTPATLKSDSSSSKWSTASYLMYEKIYNYGEFAVAPKCTIIGGTYTAKAATTTAYGVRLNGPAISADSDGDGNVAVAYGQLDIDNAEIIAQTNGTTTCYGVWAGGPTTINRCNITASPKTTTCCGLFIEAGKTTLTNSTITATGDATVRGIYVNARIAAVSSTQNVNTEFAGVAGMECIGELEATNNTVTATATNGNTAYGIYLHAVKGNTASGPFAGDHAIAGKATINSGKYTATATGTTAYGIGMLAQVKQGDIYGRPECHVINGKFYGLASGGTDGSVDANGQMNYFVLSGGYYNKNTNLSKYVEEGKNINDVLSGTTEFTEGYRYTIGSGVSGATVCRVYQGTTEKAAYATLKEALQYVNSNTGTNLTIVMVGNHTLPKGNYVLPAKATLVVPESLTRKSAMGTAPTREAVNTPAPVQFLMLTFDKGVNMTVYGTIETTAKQNAANGGSAIAGAPHGPYGRLHLVAGSKITLENGANLNCWGYTTGKGEITAMSGSTVREGFQLGYWRGGSATSSMLSNRNSWHAFPVTDYFIQNVEAPIMFRPGSSLLGYSAINWTLGLEKADNVKLLGTSSSMFLMDPADASADTYVKKEYDTETDRAVWTVNSGAKLGQFSFSLAGQTVNSADYYLPVSNNMTIYINEGEFTVTQDALLIPGAQIIISKLGKLTVASGKRLFVMDNEDWPGFLKKGTTTVSRWYYNATYSPSWTTNPRTAMYPPTTTRLPDAEIFVHGTTEGQYYTTEHGANIHSTNEDAGVVRFVANAGANTSIQHVVNTDNERVTINFTSAKLKNEDTSNPYTTTAGTTAGDAYTYMDYMWVNVRENGCLLTRTDGTGTHQLAHPSDVVAVEPNSTDNAYHSETGSRNFIFAEKKVTTAGCVWWEAEKVTTGEHVGDYKANQEQFDNYGGYYYWDASAGYWKPRFVTVTWKNYDGSALATYSNVIYNTSPHYSGVTPKIPANTSIATYAWTGWDDPNGIFHHKDSILPRATGNITYTAHIQETKYEYLITFKNNAGKVMHTEMFEAGTIPVCPPEKIQRDPTTSQVFTFTGWDKTITAVTGPETYTAQFTGSPRPYTVTFVDYDMSFLADTIIGYGNMAAYPTLADEPYRESTDAYSYEWIGWTKALATVTKDVTYIAKYKQTTIKYRVVFKSDCWGQNDGDEGCVEKIHSQKDYALGATVTVPANPSRPQTAQYTYAFDHWDPAVGPVEAGGATYTAVYTKTPRTYAINYKDKNNATFSGTHGSGYPTTHTYGTATPLVNPTRTGYTFEGWYSVADCSSGKITAVPADVAAAYTVYANWTPNTNTAYTVKHFKQNIDGTYNTTPDDTDNLTGTTATSVTPDRKTYTGFTSPAAQTKSILADGSLVIEYKYTRNSYKLTWALAGGKVTVAGTGAAVDATGSPYSNVKFDDAIVTPSVARTGYTFAGWDATPASKMPAAATTYTAQWNPIVYNITYKDQNGAAFSGVHGDGYPATHTYGTATALVSPTKAGYTFQGWYTASDCVSGKVTSLGATTYTADITLYALWKANTNTAYTVKHYKQNLDGTYPAEPAETQSLTGTTGASVTPAVKTYTGFTAPATQTKVIAADGSMVIEYQYTRNSYELAWDANGGAFSGTYTNGSVKYEAPITAPTANRTGYTFNGWSPALLETMPAADKTFTAQWTANTNTAYTVKHYQENLDGTYPAEPTETDNLTGTTGASVTPARKTYDGFTSPAGQQVTIAADGSLVVEYRYTRKSYTLKWNLASGTVTVAGTAADAGATGTPNASVKYKTPIVVPTVTRTGYTFGGWNETPAPTMPAAATTYTASWTPVTYNITYLDQNGDAFSGVHGDGYPTTHTYGTATALVNPTKAGYTFKGWYTASDCASGKVTSLGATTYTADITLYALWTLNNIGYYVDIVDVDNTAHKLILNVTNWASKGWPYEINGVSYEKTARETDRTLKIPYEGEPGEPFTVGVKNTDGTIVSLHIYTIPTEVKTNTELASQQVVYVKNGATLTVSSDKTVKNIYVAPGAKLVVDEDVTLTADTVFLRTTPWESAELENEGTISAQVCYTRIISKKDAYYQFGLPMPCNISKVRLSDGNTPVYGNGWLLRSYSEASRAVNGMVDDEGNEVDNWVTLTNTGTDKTIKGRVGYEMFSNSGYYREYYFPVAHTGLANSIDVTCTTENAKSASNSGWNVVVSPLMHTYINNPKPEGFSFCWLQPDGSYAQLPVDEVKPAIPFSYQAKSNGSISFEGTTIAMQALAPRRVAASEEPVRIQWFRLDITDANGEGDQTSIYSHPTRYEETYKRGIDVAKQSMKASRALIYSTHAYGNMAFAGVSDEKLEQGIALTVYSPLDQELTISMRQNEWLDRMAYVWLVDTETGAMIDLLESDYTAEVQEGTTRDRFYLSGAFHAPQIATSIDNTESDIRIYNANGNIAISGVAVGTPVLVFDAVGHMLYYGNANGTELEIPAPSAGVYMLHVGNQTAKMIISK